MGFIGKSFKNSILRNSFENNYNATENSMLTHQKTILSYFKIRQHYTMNKICLINDQKDGYIVKLKRKSSPVMNQSFVYLH